MDETPPIRSRRHHVSLAPTIEAVIRGRIEAVRRLGFATDFSKEISACILEADGNNRRVRGLVLRELSTILAGVESLRGQLVSKTAAGTTFVAIHAAAERMRAAVTTSTQELAGRDDGIGHP